MDNLWTLAQAFGSTYFNISLLVHLQKCYLVADENFAKDVYEKNENEDSEKGVSKSTSSFMETFDFLFGYGPSAEESVVHTDLRKTSESKTDCCHDFIHSHFSSSISTTSLTALCVTAFSLCLLLSIGWKYVWKRGSDLLKKNKGAKSFTGNEEIINKTKKEEAFQSESCKQPISGKETTPSSSNSETASKILPVIIPVTQYRCMSGQFTVLSVVRSSTCSEFLVGTIEQLQTAIEWILGTANPDQFSPSDSQNQISSMASITSNIQRRGSVRRPRWQAPKPLSFSSDNSTADAKPDLHMWQKIDEMARKMQWTNKEIHNLDVSTVKDNRLSSVLHFYQQKCQIHIQQWEAACLMVNYTLTLLQQELLNMADGAWKSSLQFVDLRSFGSASSGSCIVRADRYDVLLVVVPSTTELTVYHHGACEDVPPGMLMLRVQEAASTISTKTSSLYQKDGVRDVFGVFLSQKEVVKVSQKMLSSALEKLKFTHNHLLEQLPFTLQLDQYSELQLTLETKLLQRLGFGLPKITITFTPAVRVSTSDCEPLPTLYAVPPWRYVVSSPSVNSTKNSLQFHIMRNQKQSSDLLWQLEGSEITKAFESYAQHSISSSGYKGCQVMCQKLLRGLFSHRAKDALLNMGELHPHVLDSVVHFLLLESRPALWDLACLPDRLSDCVHFLRSAVQSSWMPDFLVHNPHLLKRMPVLQMLRLLSTGHQENILSSIRSDQVETVLTFIDSRLQETGLKCCLKDEFSTEMWEYEFFIFC